MNANQARSLASKQFEKSLADKLQKINNQIESAAKSGGFSISVVHLDSVVAAHLRTEGFKIRNGEGDYRDQATSTISWD